MSEQFLQLLKVAFEGIENDTVIFYSPPRDFVNLGFLDAVSALHKKDYTYNFLHLTIQEFFAAYYISRNESSGREIFKQHGKDKRWNVVWRFVAGLTNFKDYESHIEEDVFFDRDPKKSSIVVSLFFIQCFFEAKSMKYNLNVSNLRSLTYGYFSSSALDIYALGYCIANFPTGSTLWILEINNAAVEFLVSGLTLKQPVAGAGIIGEFYLSIMPESKINLAAFKFGHHFRSLRVLSLAGSGSLYSSRDLIDLSKIIPDMHCLETLDISTRNWDVPGDHENHSRSMLRVLQKLSGSSVTSLNIKETGFTTFFKESHREYYPALKALIEPSSGKLKELSVGDHDSDYRDSADHLMEPLSSSSSLETLHLHYLPPHLSLMNNTNLTKLTVFCGTSKSAPELSAITIAEIVKHSMVLKHLEVKRFSIPTDINALKIIANAVIYNNTALKSVELSVLVID